MLISSFGIPAGVSAAPPVPGFKHGLSFLATLAFVGGFFGARLFHLAFPGLMVITQGVHFHHFWYGLILVGVSGWMGLVYHDERLDRIYAVGFGLGVGFIGDEVGLLLTFDNYYSELTLDFFVAAAAFLILVALLSRYGKQIEMDVLRLSTRERLSHLGFFLAGFSTIFFAFGSVAFGFVVGGIVLLLAGVLLFLWAYERKRKEARSPPA
jgi:hypothetical protein